MNATEAKIPTTPLVDLPAQELFDLPADKATEVLGHAVAALTRWQAAYLEMRAAIEESGRDARWEFSKTALFSGTNYMAEVHQQHNRRLGWTRHKPGLQVDMHMRYSTPPGLRQHMQTNETVNSCASGTTERCYGARVTIVVDQASMASAGVYGAREDGGGCGLLPRLPWTPIHQHLWRSTGHN